MSKNLFFHFLSLIVLPQVGELRKSLKRFSPGSLGVFSYIIPSPTNNNSTSLFRLLHILFLPLVEYQLGLRSGGEQKGKIPEVRVGIQTLLFVFKEGWL